MARQDVEDVAVPAMAHRLLLDFRAQAQGLRHEHVIQRLVAKTRAQAIPRVSMWTREFLQKL